MGRTLSEKVWDRHVVHAGESPSEPDLLYIDLHLLHEVTSPQAFEGLRMGGRKVRRPDLTVATADHNVPTLDIPTVGAGGGTIARVDGDGRLTVGPSSAGAVPGDAWSDFLPGSKDIEADWVTLKCGNYNTKTKVCSGQNYK